MAVSSIRAESLQSKVDLLLPLVFNGRAAGYQDDQYGLELFTIFGAPPDFINQNVQPLRIIIVLEP